MSQPSDPKPGEITPEAVYRNRRFFMKSAIWGGTALSTAGLYEAFKPRP